MSRRAPVTPDHHRHWDSMSLAGLLAAVAEDPQLRTALDIQSDMLGITGGGERDLVAPSALRPVLSAALATGAAGGPGRFVLAVTATAREAEDLTAALRAFLPPSLVATFPGWETLPHERLSPRSDTVGQRIAVLRRLAHPEILGAAGADPGLAPGEGAMGEGLPRQGDMGGGASHAGASRGVVPPDWQAPRGDHSPGGGIAGPLKVVVAPVRAVLQPIVAGLGDLVPVRLVAGDDADPEDVIARLIDIGYARVEMVSKRGELAVRGGLLDVFPPTEEHPLRVEFFGDTVEEIRVFKVADQRSAGQAEHGLWAPPCRELLLTPTVRARAKELAAKHPGVSEILGKIADGITVEGMEAFSSVLADRMDLLLDHLPLGAVVLACDPERIRTRAIELVATSQEFLEASWASAASGGEAPVDLGGSAFQPIEKIRETAAELGIAWWTLAPFSHGGAEPPRHPPWGSPSPIAPSPGRSPGTAPSAPRTGGRNRTTRVSCCRSG